MSDVSDRIRTVSIFVFMGFLMTIGMAIGTVTSPEGGQFHEVVDPQVIIDTLVSSSPADLQARLIGIVLDNFFILGYLAIFYGIYLLVQNKDPFLSKFAFAFGIGTGVCDMIENAIHVALINGIPAGWTPDPLIFVGLWSFTFIKDITSYMAGLVFVILLILDMNKPTALRFSKIVLAILVGVYVSLGSIAIVIPSVLTIRNLSFMIDMGIGSYFMFSISRKLDPSKDGT
ncbi:MAG: hypothetical protein ACFFED_08905 [Candidatus Thorarchaeota archaeon]